MVFDPNAMGELHRRTQRPFLTNEANNTLREREREVKLIPRRARAEVEEFLGAATQQHLICDKMPLL